MEWPEEILHEIHRYLSGGGTPEERADFEQRMQADEALAQEVTAQRRIWNGLRANAYKSVFKDIHAQLQNEGALAASTEQDENKIIPLTPESRFALRWPYFAAAASILIAFGLIWYFNSQPTSNPIASDPPVPQKPASSDTIKPAKSDIIRDTEKIVQPKQKLAPAPPANVNKTDFFAEYFDEKPVLESPFSKEKLGLSPSALKQWQSDTAHVHQGVRYLARRDAELALQELKQVETSRFPQVKSTSAWYIALAYLQREDLENCADQLKKIAADPGNPNSQRATELLAKIQ